MLLKGKLETSHFPTLLQLLCHKKKTGVLDVRDGDNVVKIFVKDGNIAHASSSQKERRLGHLLKAKGVVSAKDLQKCLKLAKEKKQKIGRILVAKGHISAARLKGCLRQQAREIIRDVFLWEKGRFAYRDVAVKTEGKPVAPMNTMELILEASRGIDELSVIKKQIPNDELVFKPTEGSEERKESNLTKRERYVLSLIDGSRSIRQVVDESKCKELAAYKIIHSLIAFGLIEKAQAVRDEKKEAVDYSPTVKIYTNILRATHKDLKAKLGKGAFGLFEECKAELPPKQRAIFQNFDVRKPVGTNMLRILDVMDAFRDSEQGLLFLRSGFSALLQGILKKEVKLLGLRMARKTLKEIETSLPDEQDHQNKSDDSIGILRQIRQTML